MVTSRINAMNATIVVVDFVFYCRLINIVDAVFPPQLAVCGALRGVVGNLCLPNDLLDQ